MNIERDIRWYGECAVIVATIFAALADLRVHGFAAFVFSALCAIGIVLITYYDMLHYRYHGVWASGYGNLIRIAFIVIQVFAIEWIFS